MKNQEHCECCGNQLSDRDKNASLGYDLCSVCLQCHSDRFGEDQMEKLAFEERQDREEILASLCEIEYEENIYC